MRVVTMDDRTGGVIGLPRSQQLTPYAVRAERNVDEKVRLGRSGAALIADGMTAFFYGGTTVLEAARFRVASAAAISRIITCVDVPADVADKRRMVVTVDFV